MNLLLGFSPFLLFAALEHVLGVTSGLVAAAVASGLLVLRDVRAGERRAVAGGAADR